MPAWEGKGDDRWGEEEDVAVPRDCGLSCGGFDSNCRRRRLIASNSSQTFNEDKLPSVGWTEDSVFPGYMVSAFLRSLGDSWSGL